MRLICKPVKAVTALICAVAGLGLSGCGGGSTDPDIDIGADFSDSLVQVKTTFTDEDPQLFGEIVFVWDEVAGATHYQFFYDPDGDSDDDGEPEFVQVGADIPAIPAGTDPLQASLALSVHLFDWENARVRVDWCDAMGCTELGRQAARFLSRFFISPLINAGTALAYSEDGTTLAVGAPRTSIFDCEVITAVPEDEVDEECEYPDTLTPEEVDELFLQESIPFAGSVGVFIYRDGIWGLQSILKASNIEEFDAFGSAVAISDDGDTLAVAAIAEDSNATGVDGDGANNDAVDSGAVYVFERTDIGGGEFEWNEVAYIKASNTDGDVDPDDSVFDGDGFGNKLALSGDGTTLAVGAPREDSNALGIDGDEADNSAMDAGAVYVFRDLGGPAWMQEAYIKPSNTDAGDEFGSDLALSTAGDRLAVGAPFESSGSSGINGDGFNNGAATSGAAYVFERSGSAWSQHSYLKAMSPDPADEFGFSLDLNAAGDVLAVGATREDGILRGVDVDQANNGSVNTGAAYVFEESGGAWAQTAFMKASNADPIDQFGFVVKLSSSGDALVATSLWEGGRSQGINGNQVLDDFVGSGAGYLFLRDGMSWQQQAYIKAPNTTPNANFGFDVDMALDGERLAISDFLNSAVYNF